MAAQAMVSSRGRKQGADHDLKTKKVVVSSLPPPPVRATPLVPVSLRKPRGFGGVEAIQ